MSSAGVAYIDIQPKLNKGAFAAVPGQIEGTMGAGAGQSVGSKFGAGIAAGITASITSMALPAIGKVLSAGFDRYSTIESATKSLGIVLGDTTSAAQMMDDVLSVVSGTPYKLDNFAQGAVNLSAFGVEAEKIPGLLESIGDAAALRGPGDAQAYADRMIEAFGKMSAKGKVTMEELNMVMEAGIPAMDMLAEHFGVTTAEMSSMIEKGAVDATTAIDVLKTGIDDFAGGAAEELGDTLQGKIMNLQTAFSRLGAEVIELSAPVLEFAAETGTAITDELGGALQVIGEDFNSLVETVGESDLGEKILGALGVDIPEEGVDWGQAASDAFMNTILGTGAAYLGWRQDVDDQEEGHKERWEGRLAEQESRLVEYEYVVQDVAAKVAIATTAQEEWAEAMSFSADQSKVLGSALDLAFGPDLDLEQRLQDWEARTINMNAALEENGNTLDIHTEKGQANRDMITGLVEDNIALAEAELAAGGDAEQIAKNYEMRHAAMVNELETLGYTRSEIDSIIGKYGEIPEEVITQLKLEQTENAAGQIKDFLDSTDRIPHDVKVNIQTLANGGNIELATILAERYGYTIDTLPNGDVIITDNGPEAQAHVDGVTDSVNKVPGSKSTTVTVVDNASGKLGNIRQEIYSLPSGKTITVTTNYVHNGRPAYNTPGHLDGREAFGGIRSYAAGGFSKLPSSAIIQPATAGLVQWAEPSTHGEAFIPLNPDRRDRSLAIWEETGRRLGAMADGGILSSSKGSGGSPTFNVYFTMDDIKDITNAAQFVKKIELEAATTF